MNSALDTVLYNLWLHTEVPLTQGEQTKKMFRLIAHGRVKGQNPKMDYFRRKFAEVEDLPYRINLVKKVAPIKKRGAGYKIKIIAEGAVIDLPRKLEKKGALEKSFREFLTGLRLRGWKVYTVACKKLKENPSRGLVEITGF